MERHVAKLTRKLDAYLETCRDIMLYIPYESQDLLEFLDSCSHQQFRAALKERGFRETALFTENRKHGRLFLFLSCRNVDFDSTAARALVQSRVLSEDSGIMTLDLWSCYVFKSNKLLEQENFYSRSRNGEALAPILGAEWLLTCLAARERLYSTH